MEDFELLSVCQNMNKHIEKIYIYSQYVPPLSNFFPFVNYDQLPRLPPSPSQDTFDVSAFESCMSNIHQMECVGTLILKSQMGSGKTTAVLRFVSNLPHGLHCLIISNRRSILLQLSQHEGVSLYSDLGNQNAMLQASTLCITLESLPKLVSLNTILPKFDVVIIDELPATLQQVLSSTVQGQQLTMTLLEHFVRDADQVIVCASDIAEEDVEIVTSMRRKRTVFVQNVCATNPETLYIHKSKDNFIDDLIMSICCKQKVYIAADEVGWLHRIQAKILDCWWPTARVREYSSSTSSQIEVLEELRDPNTSWQKFDIVLCSPTITHGVDFNIPSHFQRVFYFVGGRTIVPRCIVQALRRVRQTVTHEVHLFVNKKASDKLTTDWPPPLKTLRALHWIKWKVNENHSILELDTNDALTKIGLKLLKEQLTLKNCTANIINGWRETGGKITHVQKIQDNVQQISGSSVITIPGRSKTHSFDCSVSAQLPSFESSIPSFQRISCSEPKVINSMESIDILGCTVPFTKAVGDLDADTCTSILQLFFSLLFDLGLVLEKQQWVLWITDTEMCTTKQHYKFHTLLALMESEYSELASVRKTAIISKVSAVLKCCDKTRYTNVAMYRLGRIVRTRKAGVMTSCYKLSVCKGDQ